MLLVLHFILTPGQTVLRQCDEEMAVGEDGSLSALEYISFPRQYQPNWYIARIPQYP